MWSVLGHLGWELQEPGQTEHGIGREMQALGGHIFWALRNPYVPVELWADPPWLEQGCPKWDSGQGPLAPELRVGSLRCLSPSLPHLQPPRPRSALPGLSQLSTEHSCWHYIRTSKYEFFLPVSPSSSHCTTP